MKFEIFCDRCMKIEKVKTLLMGMGGRMEVQLKCGHWVYLKMAKYLHCGHRLKISEIELLGEEKVPLPIGRSATTDQPSVIQNTFPTNS